MVSIRIEKEGKVSPLPRSKFGSMEARPAERRTAFSKAEEVLFGRAMRMHLEIE